MGITIGVTDVEPDGPRSQRCLLNGKGKVPKGFCTAPLNKCNSVRYGTISLEIHQLDIIGASFSYGGLIFEKTESI